MSLPKRPTVTGLGYTVRPKPNLVLVNISYIIIHLYYSWSRSNVGHHKSVRPESYAEHQNVNGSEILSL